MSQWLLERNGTDLVLRLRQEELRCRESVTGDGGVKVKLEMEMAGDIRG